MTYNSPNKSKIAIKPIKKYQTIETSKKKLKVNRNLVVYLSQKQSTFRVPLFQKLPNNPKVHDIQLFLNRKLSTQAQY